MSTLDDLQKNRIEKLEKIRALGIDPYPATFNRKQTNNQALKRSGEEVSVAGRLRGIRGHGGSTFADLVDESGKIQLFFSKQELTKKILSCLNFLIWEILLA